MGARSRSIIALMFSLALAPEPAGASTYDVSTVSSNWIASTGHTVISAWAAGICPDTIGDDSLSAPLNLGFSFRLGATSFTQLRVSTNGRVQFNNTYCNNGSAAAGNPRTYRNPLPDANFGNVLRIYGADLDVSAAGTITYATTGTAPNRIFVVTWNNVSAWRQGGAQNRGAGTSYNLQIQLHENGDFYFVYGTSDDISEPSNTAMGPAQIGWQIDLKDYALIGTGLPSNGTAYRFTLARSFAEYRMDEGSWNGAAGEVADSSGNGRNGSRVASPLTASVVQTIAAGKVCRAMDVPDNGGNSQFDAVNSGVTPSGVGSLGSITFWWRARSSWNGSANYLFDATTQASRLFYLGKRNNGRLRFEITDNASTPVTVAAETANQSVAANTWKHIAVTWRLVAGTSATILNIYLDGALVATASGTTNGQFNASLNTLYIGDNRSSASNGMTGSPTSADGTIDEFRIYPRTLTAADVLSVMAETRATCPSLGASHFVLSHSGHGINCRVEPVAVYALDGLNGLVGTYSGATTLTTQSGRGTWSLISGHGTLADSTPDDGLASYQFVPADGGQAVFGVYYPAGSSPIDIAVYQTDDPTIHDDGIEGPLAFSPNGFTVTGSALSNPPPGSIDSPVTTQTAGTTFQVYLTAYGQTPTDPQCGVIETYTGPHQLSFWNDHVNPSPGVMNATVNSATVGWSEAAATAQNVTFSLGQAQLSIKYKDVGSIRLQMKDSTALPSEIRGSTNAFVVKPANLAITRVETLTGVANPGATNAVGPAFVAAGAPFRIEVDALDSEGSLTPSFGTETPPEGIRIGSSTLIVPAGGRNGSSGTGTLGGAIAFAPTATKGRFRDDSATFDEAGIIRIVASVADGDYLGGGAVNSTPSGNVGRFPPARFALAAGSSVVPACTGFTYMDDAQLGVHYRLEAREANGGITQNYDATLLGTNAVATIAAAAENGDAGTDLGARLSSIVVPWTLGAATFDSTTTAFRRNPAPDGPYDALDIGIRTIDPLHDTSLSAANMNAATTGDCTTANNCDAVKIGSAMKVRHGRFMVKPAFGPESLPLGVSLEAQYFDGSLFARNTLDACTTYASSQASLSGFNGNLSVGETTVTAPGTATTLVSGESTTTAPLSLSAPGIGNDGAVDVRVDVPAYLEFDWSGTGATDPTGNARFGRYRGDDRIVFWREL